MASRSIILFLSLLSTFSFAKPSWKLIEVENHVEADNEEKKASEEAGHEQDLDVEEEQDGKDYRQVIGGHTCSDFLNSYFERKKRCHCHFQAPNPPPIDPGSVAGSLLIAMNGIISGK